MKISEIDLLKIKQGLRFQSLDGESKGTVIAVNYLDDFSVYFIWDNEKEVNNWFGNDCDCELLIDSDIPIYDVSHVKKEYLFRQEDFNKSLLKFAHSKITEKNSKLFGLKLPDNEEEKITTILEKLF